MSVKKLKTYKAPAIEVTSYIVENGFAETWKNSFVVENGADDGHVDLYLWTDPNMNPGTNQNEQFELQSSWGENGDGFWGE